MAYHNDLGKWGEEVAVNYLQQQGYTILYRNWMYQHRDLDIVAMDAGALVIVEVKTRCCCNTKEGAFLVSCC